MGTRCGTLDPGVILYLLNERRMSVRAVERLIDEESRLLGVSGVSSDMRTLLRSAEPRARLAIDVYVYRIRRELGSLAGALGGLDALVFTAGVGEKPPRFASASAEMRDGSGSRSTRRPMRPAGRESARRTAAWPRG
jgi:acetate kinase